MTQAVNVRTTVHKRPAARSVTHLVALIPAISAAGPSDYPHDLGCSLRTRQGARPIARLTVGFWDSRPLEKRVTKSARGGLRRCHGGPPRRTIRIEDACGLLSSCETASMVNRPAVTNSASTRLPTRDDPCGGAGVRRAAGRRRRRDRRYPGRAGSRARRRHGGNVSAGARPPSCGGACWHRRECGDARAASINVAAADLA